MSKNYYVPAICWLRVTDFMRVWVENELGGEARVGEQRVVCVQHLPGAREVLRMETTDELPGSRMVGNAISVTWHKALEAGMAFDTATMEREYGVTKDAFKLFVPIECPKMALTKNGVLRPWTVDTCFGVKQTTALQRLLREAFWQSVGEFAEKYAAMRQGEKYAQVDMIEAFCEQTDTPDMYAEAMRREWQRRQKRQRG